MAVRQDITVDYTVSPRIATVAAPSTTITIQDLYDSLSDIQTKPWTMMEKILVKAAGKDDLGGGKSVGITCVLQNTRLAFAARSGPSYVQCTVTGGNLVAVDAANATINEIEPTAFTQVVVEKSTSASIVQPTGIGIAKGIAANNFPIAMYRSGIPKSGLSVSGQILKDGGSFVSLANSVVEIGNGMYRVDLTAVELDGNIITLKFIASGADPRLLTIVTNP